MAALAEAEAELFDRAIQSGRNRPIVVAARTAAGDLLHCVVKLAARVNNPPLHPLACMSEWMAAALAQELGIAVPPHFAVSITAEFAASIADREVRTHALASLGLTFGSVFLDGRSESGGTYTQNVEPLPPELRPAAVELLAFDVYIHNPDRRRGNPNLFLRRSDILAFDHGDAFSFLFAIGGDAVRDPLLGIVSDHALASALKGRPPGLERFRTALGALSDQVIAEAAACCPQSWEGGSQGAKLGTICDVLRRRRDAMETWLPQVEAWLEP